MEAHAYSLRDEVGNEITDKFKRDWRSAGLDEATEALIVYAEKLTREPASVTEEDIERLRERGLSDRAIHDAAQVISYFNYINRIADGLGVDLEEWMPEKAAG